MDISLPAALASMQALYRDVKDSINTGTFSDRFWSEFQRQLAVLCVVFTQLEYKEESWLQAFIPLVREAVRTTHEPDIEAVKETLQRFSADGLMLRRGISASMAPNEPIPYGPAIATDRNIGASTHSNMESHQGDNPENKAILLDSDDEVPATQKIKPKIRIKPKLEVIDTIELTDDSDEVVDSSPSDKSTNASKTKPYSQLTKGKQRAMDDLDPFNAWSVVDDHSADDGVLPIPKLLAKARPKARLQAFGEGPDRAVGGAGKEKEGKLSHVGAAKLRKDGGKEILGTREDKARPSRGGQRAKGISLQNDEVKRAKSVGQSGGEGGMVFEIDSSQNLAPCKRCAQKKYTCVKNGYGVGKACEPCRQSKQRCSDLDIPPPWAESILKEIRSLTQMISAPHREKPEAESRVMQAMSMEPRPISGTQSSPVGEPSAMECEPSFPSFRVRPPTPTLASAPNVNSSNTILSGPGEAGSLGIDVVAPKQVLPQYYVTDVTDDFVITDANHTMVPGPLILARVRSKSPMGSGQNLFSIPKSPQTVASCSPIIGGIALDVVQTEMQFVQGSSLPSNSLRVPAPHTNIYHPMTGSRIATPQPDVNGGNLPVGGQSPKDVDDDIEDPSRPESETRVKRTRNSSRVAAVKKQRRAL